MEKVKWPTGLCVFLWCVLASLPMEGLLAQSSSNEPIDFELQNNDRVVFLGNSLFENDLQYNYIEFLLTTRFPNHNISFRNLGWAGDTVFGEARSYYTSPPSAYELLIQQLTDANPTVVFLAYGANEAVKGEEGIEEFEKGLNKLLDKIDSLGARTILLSPIPQLPTELPVNLEERNQNLKLYMSAISKVATIRDKRFIDIFTPIQIQGSAFGFSDDGVHLNELGYFHLAGVLEDKLNLSSLPWEVNVNVTNQKLESSVPSSKVSMGKDGVQFTLEENYMPLDFFGKQKVLNQDERLLKIQGLKRGYYSLSIDGVEAVSGSAGEWSKGITILQGPPRSRAMQLRELIFKKNELFFHQYRPQNRTYIIGFRAYEQGRHKEGLKELGVIVEWLEGQIATIRSPKSNVYKLSPIK